MESRQKCNRGRLNRLPSLPKAVWQGNPIIRLQDLPVESQPKLLTLLQLVWHLFEAKQLTKVQLFEAFRFRLVPRSGLPHIHAQQWVQQCVQLPRPVQQSGQRAPISSKLSLLHSAHACTTVFCIWLYSPAENRRPSVISPEWSATPTGKGENATSPLPSSSPPTVPESRLRSSLLRARPHNHALPLETSQRIHQRHRGVSANSAATADLQQTQQKQKSRCVAQLKTF